MSNSQTTLARYKKRCIPNRTPRFSFHLLTRSINLSQWLEIVENIKKRFHELDPCTNSNYSKFKVVNTDLTLTVSFETKTLTGKVIYDLINLEDSKEVILDTSVLDINEVKVNGTKVDFELKPVKAPYGSPLVIPVQGKDLKVEIDFKTTDKCTAIQFIQGDTGPYVFSQCEAIHARSLFPCFDTPAVKSPYKFTGHSPAVVTMSGRPQKVTNQTLISLINQFQFLHI